MSIQRKIAGLWLFLLFSLAGVTVFAQDIAGFPIIGKPMPGFKLDDLNFHTKTKISSADLKGKWYVLDFWIAGCKPCMESFPKVSKMVKEFKGKAEIIQVGIGGEELKKLYDGIRKKQGLEIPMAYDTKLADQWQINSYPQIYIVDAKGILRVVTYELSAEKLQELMDNGTDSFAKLNDYKAHFQDNVFKPYFINNNGGNDSTFLFRSVLARANAEHLPSGDANFNQEGPEKSPFNPNGAKWMTTVNMKKGMFQISQTSLLTLYNTAYFGQDRAFVTDSIYKEAVLIPPPKKGILWPFLELKDSSDFKYNFQSLQGLYTYSLSMPKEKASRESMMRAMRSDLLKYFGYDARIETRKMPVRRLVISDKALVAQLRTKGADPATGIFEPSKWHLINGEIFSVIRNLWFNNQFGPVLLDETGIDYDIDLLLEASFEDLEGIKRELKKNGLELIDGEKEMKVLVIRDPAADKI